MLQLFCLQYTITYIFLNLSIHLERDKTEKDWVEEKQNKRTDSQHNNLVQKWQKNKIKKGSPDDKWGAKLKNK